MIASVLRKAFHMSATLSHPHNVPRLQPMALATIVLAHAGVLLAWSMARGPVLVPPEPFTMVSVVTSAAPVARAEPTAAPARTKSVQPAPTRPQAIPAGKAAQNIAKPLLSTTEDAPAVTAAPADNAAAQPTRPNAVSPVAPSNNAATHNSVSAGGGVNGVAAAPPTAQVIAPRFDAAYLDNPAPGYPPLSRKANEQGKVVLQVWVDAQGQAKQVEVRTSSGYERLDRAAFSAVSRWKFVPARQGSEAVAATVLVPIVFSFKD